ncbi:uncharacterized protein V1510DRAFT_414952 [Dipodascopsis tothii]|uniref:uncharacterized protein n=1 Tax=Dipodascopsis tothii TaxID=44089 RepID=UPI0034CDEB62
MPPKSDIHKSSWEDTAVPAVCETCLGPNPYIKMMRERYGAECKLCTRPFTVFRWMPEPNTRYKKTGICRTCSQQKNCCQCCMLDLTFGLPLAIRDAALRMVEGSTSSSTSLTTVEPQNVISKQFVAQAIEQRIKEGQGDHIFETQSRTEIAGRELLKRLAQAEPYYRKSNVANFGGETEGEGADAAGESAGKPKNRANLAKLVAKVGEIGGKLTTPKDPKIMSLFLTGVDDDLPEYELRRHFEAYGALKSVVCSHRARCAFVNYTTREDAEKAADATGTAVVIRGCPLRVTWGRPRALGDDAHGAQNVKLAQANKRKLLDQARAALGEAPKAKQPKSDLGPKLPPGQGRTVYESQRADYEE